MPEEKKRSRRFWRVQLPIAVLAVLFALLWWRVPPALYSDLPGSDDARLKAVSDTRTALLAGLIGLGALLTFWLNRRIYQVTAQTFELSRQGQISERYTKAIEQLGSDKLDVRLGGIYALEQIVSDSERYHPTVVQVLSAFVREHGRTSSRLTPAQVLSTLRQRDNSLTGQSSVSVDERPGPAADVQVALTVLGRLPLRPGLYRGDLFGARLAGAELTGFLFKADLRGANLSAAKLINVDLREAWLSNANLSKAEFLAANLSKADLSDADLSGADLNGANLSGASLTFADLFGAKLTGTRGLDPPQLTFTRGDAQTETPPGMKRPDEWSKPSKAAETAPSSAPSNES
jgi:Pentapeptide repeats (8 copies)